jgi:hypothetical protein
MTSALRRSNIAATGPRCSAEVNTFNPLGASCAITLLSSQHERAERLRRAMSRTGLTSISVIAGCARAAPPPFAVLDKRHESMAD